MYAQNKQCPPCLPLLAKKVNLYLLCLKIAVEDFFSGIILHVLILSQHSFFKAQD